MGRRRALLVGNKIFLKESDLQSLQGPENDVNALGRVLANPALGNFEIEKFIDQKSYEIRRAIVETLQSAKRDDFVLIYYSGHGKTNAFGRLYLATADTTASALQATAISAWDFHEAVSESSCGEVLLLLDCCYSGAVSQGLRGAVDGQLQAVQAGAGFFILTASTNIQTASENEANSGGLPMGRFTAAVVDGIQSGAADLQRRGEIRLNDLREYVEGTLRGQTPRFFAHQSSGDPLISYSSRSILNQETAANLDSDAWSRRLSAEPDQDVGVRQATEYVLGEDTELSAAIRARVKATANKECHATVYFATNRKPDPSETGGFGADIVANDPAAMTYAAAEVTGISLADEFSSRISDISERIHGKFTDAAQAAIIGAGKNLLIFIHGFDNTFRDAITRAAYNREWLAASGIAAADTTVVAFTWPSEGKLIAAPPHFPPKAYRADRAQAGKSGPHITCFLSVIDRLRVDYRARNPNGRIFLLAHSMGSYALEAGLRAWLSGRGSEDLMFDEVFLPGADVTYDSFERLDGSGLSNLPNVSKRISLYYSRRDVALSLSLSINLSPCLGFDGPKDKHNPTRYQPTTFRLVDCTEVSDFDPLNPPDAGHQYYRRSVRVLADIAACMEPHI